VEASAEVLHPSYNQNEIQREDFRVAGGELDNFLDSIETLDWTDFQKVSAQTKEILRRLAGDKVLLRRLVDGVADDPDLLAQCEHHRLLDRLVVYDALDRGFRIRIHISTDSHLDRPHDHRFSFTTRILRGSYLHTLHDWPADDESATAHDVVPQFVTEEKVGASYSLHHSVVHTTFTTPDTVSLFLRGPAEKERSIITERETEKVWWRYGAEDEPAERRAKVSVGHDGYRNFVARLEKLDIV
jgi:hypothetical protein